MYLQMMYEIRLMARIFAKSVLINSLLPLYTGAIAPYGCT